MAAKSYVRALRESLLIVGEGDGEVALLKHLKSLYTSGGQGRAMTIRNASGKGARQVIDYTLRQRDIGDFTESAALFDTDADWSDQVAARARKFSVTALPVEPCLEALLLTVAGERAHGTSAQLKAAFALRFGGPAHQPNLIARNYSKEMFDAARGRIAVLDAMLRSAAV